MGHHENHLIEDRIAHLAHLTAREQREMLRSLRSRSPEFRQFDRRMSALVYAGLTGVVLVATAIAVYSFDGPRLLANICAVVALIFLVAVLSGITRRREGLVWAAVSVHELEQQVLTATRFPGIDAEVPAPRTASTK